MKKLTIFFILLFAIVRMLAQESGLSVTLSYPVTIGDNFFDEYTGYIDAGLQYRFWKKEHLQIGISANIGFYGYTWEPGTAKFTYNAMLVHPRILGEFPLGRQRRIRPIVGIGYGFNRIKTSVENDPNPDTNYTFDGVNINAGLAYNFTETLFLLAQYDWAEIDRSTQTIGNEKFNNNSHLIKLGLGYRF